MINLSQLARKLKLKEQLVRSMWFGYTGPEVFLAENLRDYLENSSHLHPPLYKRHPFTVGNYYGIVLIHNVGIDGVFLNDILVEDAVNVHDSSGSKLILWTPPGTLLPACYSYKEAREKLGLQIKDWVYGLSLRHLYERNWPFIFSVDNNKRKRTELKKQSLIDRLNDFLPDFEPIPKPA